MANTLKVTVENSDVLTHAVMNGLDGSDVIATGRDAIFPGSATSYTAPRDCWVSIVVSSNIGSMTVDDGKYWLYQTQNWQCYCIPLRKGQVLKVGSRNQVADDTKPVVYGVKR